MTSLHSPLSTLHSPPLVSGLGNMSYKQFKRTYPGNYSFNFATCLSGINDVSVKNYSNLYLTNKYKLTDIVDYNPADIKCTYTFGPLKMGAEYLSFSNIDPRPYAIIGEYPAHLNYGVPSFVDSDGDNCKMTIEFSPTSNTCHVFHIKDRVKYFLCCDSNANAVFVRESILSFSNETTNPQDLSYIYFKDRRSLNLFKLTESGNYIFSKTGNALTLIPVINNDSTSYIPYEFTLVRDIYAESTPSPNTSFIVYDGANNIDNAKSVFDLSNNFLLHRNYAPSSDTNIIVLKNQLPQNDIFSTANTLLTGGDAITPFADKFREYNSIGCDIPEEKSETLELNYTFYNKSYNISTGTTIFVAPSSMYPYEHININDTKIIECGAFPYYSPEYADRVYHLSDNPINYENGQYLLCTWLSGGATSDKVWVDRYYYPDLISKSDALAGISAFNDTYEDHIEYLIKQNSNIADVIATEKFFDKKSDLVFYPGQSYQYERISLSKLPALSSTFTMCGDYSSNYPHNYFKTINAAGELTIGFNFEGDLTDWIVKSGRNDIDSGITLEKRGSDIYFNCDLYDATESRYESGDNWWVRRSATAPITTLKTNFIMVSISTITGTGFVFLNSNIIYEFTIPIYQFTTKQLIYGDFVQLIAGESYDLLSPDIVSISNIYITPIYADSNLSMVLPLINGEVDVDTINITLPCGMRNSSDTIDLLQTICGSSTFKSNNINILVKNLNITNDNILAGIKSTITSAITNLIPTNTQLTSIDFPNYK